MQILSALFVLLALSPAAAQTTQYQVVVTYTGNVSTGTDSSGTANVFGSGTNLAGLPFTLTQTFITGVGSPSSTACSGSGTVWNSQVSDSGGANPGTAWLSIGSAGQQFQIGGGDGETSNSSSTVQDIPACSTPNHQFTTISASYGNGYSGSSTFGTISAVPVSGSFGSAADWTQPVSALALNTSFSSHFGINRTITGGGTDASASGDLLPSSMTTVKIPLNQNVETNGNPNKILAGASVYTVRACAFEKFTSQKAEDNCWKTNFQVVTFVDKDSGPDGNPEAGANPSSTGSIAVAEPVNVATGNMYHEINDYHTAGQNPLTFTRSYNSMQSHMSIAGTTVATLATTLGANWRSEYDSWLQLISAGSTLIAVYAERSDGRVIPFFPTGSTWSAASDFPITLVQSGSNWTLTDTDGTVETYTTSGSSAALQSITLRNGYTRTMTWSGGQLSTITDSYGRTLTLNYTSGTISSISTPDSTTVSYGYGTSGGQTVLTSVSYPTTPATGFTYQYTDATNPQSITAILDGAGQTVASWTYDSQNRATSSTMGGALNADATTLTYNSNGSVTVTNALGVADTYFFTYLQGVPKVQRISRAATATTAAATRVFGYDANGFLRTESDWNANVTRYINNALGLPTSVTEAYGGGAVSRTTTITYDTTFPYLPHQVVADGVTSTFTYDAGGNMLSQTDTDTTTTSTPYSTNGQTRTTQWTYNATGELLSAQLPRTDVTAITNYTYNADGSLATVADALSNTTTVVTHTGGGYPLTVTDPNGVLTTLTWDGGQRLLSSAVTTGAGTLTTTKTYDTAGNLASIEKPDGSKFTFSYDAAHRLTTITDLFGNTVNYTLDALGDATQVQVEDPLLTVTASHTATFDALGRMLTYVGGMSQTTTLTWDKNSNLLTVKDPLLHTTTMTYDHLNRLATSVDPSPGGTTTITYDDHDRVLSVKNPLNNTTSYVYDGFGDRIQEASPDSGTAVYTFNPDGDLTKQVLAGSLEADMTYDADDRLTATTYPSDSTLNTALTYDQAGHGDGIGRLTSATDKIGSLSLTYDERGNVTNESRVATGITTLNTTYAFDAGNNVSGIAYPSGTMVTYGRDSMGRVTSVSAQPPGFGSPSTIATSLTYEPFGPVTGLTYGNGVVGTYTYDADYRPTGREDNLSGTDIMNLAYTFDANDNVHIITDSVNAANGQTLGYDVLNRINSAVSGTGGYGTWSWTWDKDHNVATQVIAGTTTTFHYTASTSKLSSWVTSPTTISVTNTSAGNINLLKNGGTTIETLTYNQANELISASASGGSASYAFDLFGRRLEKLPSGGNTIVFQYAGVSTLLSEDDLHGNAADYIYLSGRPIGEVNPGTGALYYTSTDTLGTPQYLTNGSGVIAWSMTTKPFGDAQSTSGSIIQHLRYPGQYFDSETGYMHNGFRDYDPGRTRYVESDPIGLAGGINTFQYARGNPFSLFDPFGLKGDVIDYADTPKNRVLIEFANLYNDDPGHISVFAHGATLGIADVNGQPLNAQAIAAQITQTAKWRAHAGRDITAIDLFACNTGASKDQYGSVKQNVAQQIAKILNITVNAPNTYWWVNKTGSFYRTFEADALPNGEEPDLTKPGRIVPFGPSQ